MTFGAVIIDNRPVFKAIERHQKFLDCNIIHLDDKRIKSVSDYNNVMTDIKLWERISFDRVLIFQHDSGLLRKGIESFFEWDFIGAPIKHIPFPAMNGGLSLRNPKAMIEVLKNFTYNPHKHGNEDIYFCHSLQKLGLKLPDLETAKKFSIETIYGLGSLGFHAMDKYLSPLQCKTILNQYE